MDRDPYAPLSFPLISAVRLGICEVSVVWGTSDFQRVCSVSQISAFLLPRFCSGFSGSRVTGGGWVGGWGEGLITFILQCWFCCYFSNQSFVRQLLCPAGGVFIQCYTDQRHKTPADLSNINAFPRQHRHSLLRNDYFASSSCFSCSGLHFEHLTRNDVLSVVANQVS